MVKNSSTPSGEVYIVSTPIGNLNDISPRAIETLKSCDLILVEDTRHSKILLQHLNIQKPLVSMHAHNEHLKIESFIQRLKNGENLALISDAGTPLISDPGYPLIREAHQNNIKVIPIPGCCALIAALSASGIPCSTFIFAGFMLTKSAQRKKLLEEYKSYGQTVVLYESTHRLTECLQDIGEIYGYSHTICLAKELTKSHESIVNGSVNSIILWLSEDMKRLKGEFVIILSPVEIDRSSSICPTKILSILLDELPLKQAVKLTASITGIAKNDIYQQALNIKNHLDP